MRYVVQLCTGSFHCSKFKGQEVIKKLEYVMQTLDVDKVIFGWAQDGELNRAICDILEQHGIEKYLWLPVFAEIQNHKEAEPNHSIVGRQKKDISKFAGDTFEFACQSSEKSINRAMEVFDELMDGCRVDGVFLDRIRYGSAAGSFESLFGCWCPRCQELYRREGSDIERLQKLAEEGRIEAFLPERLEGFIYRYKDQDVDRLMQTKRRLISRQVKMLEENFRVRGLKVGADTFAPAIADFVGQDLESIGSEMDFIKPMTYLRTNAPAGIPFELRGLGDQIKQRLDELWGGDTAGMDLIAAQMKKLQEQNICAIPGIDANRIEGLCSSDTDYIKSFLRKLRIVGTDEVVLSWDIMHISDEMLVAAVGI